MLIKKGTRHDIKDTIQNRFGVTKVFRSGLEWGLFVLRNDLNQH